MPRICFTPHLRRFLDVPDLETGGKTLRESLAEAFAHAPRLRGYVLDEQGRLRRHVTVFVDGAPTRDRETLSDPVRPDSVLFVMQALSGG